MKSAFVLALAACVGSAYADTVLQDFEAGTAGSLIHSSWLPDFSGTSVGVDGSDDEANYSNEQANAGTLSGKLSWDWDGTASPGVSRIQPSSALGSLAAANHTAEPFIGLALYGANQGDNFTLYMRDTGYEVFTDQATINWNGWQIVERNIQTSPVVGWVNGDSSLNASACFLNGWFFYQNAPNNTRVTYYLDDIAFTAASRASSSVNNWSLY